MLIRQDLLQAIQLNPDLMKILTIIRDLELKDSWLAAGSVRNFIWNLLSEEPAFDRETDVDVIFFDPEVSYEETLAIENKLREDFPQYQPYVNSCDAMSKYPERCTAIGLRLQADATLELFAPYGLEDILNFKVSPTPYFLENEDRMKLYQKRLSKKNWQEKWKNLIFKNT